MALCGKKEQLPNLSPIVSVRRAFNASMTSFVASLFTLYDFNEGSAPSSFVFVVVVAVILVAVVVERPH